MASPDQIHEEHSTALDASVLAGGVVLHPCRIPASLSATHPLPSCDQTFFGAPVADEFVNELSISFFNANTLPMIPLFAVAIASNHPCVVVAPSADAEHLSIIVATSRSRDRGCWRGRRRP